MSNPSPQELAGLLDRAGVSVDTLHWTECGTYAVGGLKVPPRHGVAVAFAESAALGTYGIVKGTQDRYEAWLNHCQISGSYLSSSEAMASAQADYEARIFSSLKASSIAMEGQRAVVNDDMVVLRRLADGDTIAFSQDGDEAWFTKGDRAFVGNAVIRLREKGFTERRCDDEENYRGMSEYDAISDAGRTALNTLEAENG